MLGFDQSLTYRGEEKYLTPAPSSHLVPFVGGGGGVMGLRSTGEVHSPEAQVHQRTETQSQDYRALLLPLHFTTTLLKAYLQQFFLRSASCLPFNQKL